MGFKKHTKFMFASTAVLVCQAGWAAEPGALTIGTSVNYSTGKYGTSTSTDITSIPVTATYDTGPWTLKLSVPYVRISGPADVIVGVGKTSRTTTTVRTASGLGDIVAAATYNFYNDAASQSGADVTGKIKFATGDSAKGLGTGENDYSVLLDVYKKVDQITFFGGIGYTVMGSSTAVPLRNVFSFNAGSTYKLDEKSSLGFAYDHRQKSSSTGSAQNELTAFYVHKFNKTWKTQAYLLKGFSDGSPDWGGGFSVGYAF
ncbi:hypothetical protein [Polaromonas sp.]|uniref:hypothetical protein n=1 Tax=Polaromonas sp. TaxID=1869339 RepID=UPI0037509BA8